MEIKLTIDATPVLADALNKIAEALRGLSTPAQSSQPMHKGQASEVIVPQTAPPMQVPMNPAVEAFAQAQAAGASFEAALRAAGATPVVPPVQQTLSSQPPQYNVQQTLPQANPAATNFAPPAQTLPQIPTGQMPTYTIEAIATACSPLVDAGRSDELKAEIQRLGAERIGTMTPEQLGQFAVIIRGMGARI